MSYMTSYDMQYKAYEKDSAEDNVLTSLATNKVLYGSPDTLGSLCGSSARIKTKVRTLLRSILYK